MKKTIAIKQVFDITTIRKAYVFLTGQLITDEDIDKRFINREPVTMDLEEMKDHEAMLMCSAYLSLIIEAEKPKKEAPVKSKFQQRLDEVNQKRAEQMKKS